jgi:hypothetical protein
MYFFLDFAKLYTRISGAGTLAGDRREGVQKIARENAPGGNDLVTVACVVSMAPNVK